MTADAAPRPASPPTGPIPTVLSSPLAWLRGHGKLLRTVVSLIATTGITSGLGVVFWAVAAHRATLASVGNGSAALSAIALVGTFGMVGLNTALIPHLAARPREADGLLSAGLCVAAAASALLAAGFWLVAARIGNGFAPYLHTVPEGLLFIVGAALAGAALVLDEALLGLAGGSPQLWRNAAFAVGKLVALAALTMVWHSHYGTPIVAAWTVACAASLVIVTALLRRRGVRILARPRWQALRALGRTTAANTWLNNALQAPVLLAPVVVTGLLGPEDGGAFYVAFTVMTVAIMLSFHFSTALYAAGPDGFAARLRFTLRVSALGGLIGVPAVIIAAHPLLHVFGSQYAHRATLPLMLLIPCYFGNVLRNHYTVICRVRNRITAGALYATVTGAARIAALAVGALAGGLLGVAVALLVTSILEGAYALPAIRRALRGQPAAAG